MLINNKKEKLKMGVLEVGWSGTAVVLIYPTTLSQMQGPFHF